jgi:hypothetical protein
VGPDVDDPQLVTNIGAERTVTRSAFRMDWGMGGLRSMVVAAL